MTLDLKWDFSVFFLDWSSFGDLPGKWTCRFLCLQQTFKGIAVVFVVLPVSSRDFVSNCFSLCRLPPSSFSDRWVTMQRNSRSPLSTHLARDSLVLGKSVLAGLRGEDGGCLSRGKPWTVVRREARRLITCVVGDEFLLLISFPGKFSSSSIEERGTASSTLNLSLCLIEGFKNWPQITSWLISPFRGLCSHCSWQKAWVDSRDFLKWCYEPSSAQDVFHI